MSEAKQGYRVVVAGATGAVGHVMLELLAEREFPISELAVLASSRSAGSQVDFKGKSVTVQDLSEFDFSGWDYALFSAGGSVSAEHAPRAAKAGCTVIDNTSHFRLDPDVPLVVPEVNAGILDDFGTDGGIIANPNCSTIQMLLAVAPIHRAAGVARINVATYQSVSGAGAKAMEELAQQSKDRFNFRDPEVKALNAPIAFNVIPMIDVLQDNGYTKEEMKMHNETRRILDSDQIAVNATAVRVPVFFGHGEAVHLETVKPLEVEEARELLRKAPGVKVVGDEEILTPLTHASGHDETFVSRIRRDLSHPQGLDFWVVADNVRKGAALNAIQIAEYLISRR
ncbi:aspartate-semialdehyde dehydrogenase [Wenzhouxiangella sp. XN201]|uniref:aspartate-semialdehyde dehydrogenase n=1 Tax=Wenzhouxiangella sp. XN201 TaxID=2710755 RepID=UPI0013C771B0|nr:aspartate-semialdehyde dehydrogenase [Wenzhouxiangella sp. XN201]NEZ03350.1 aspartate-semialdehyde dehydrogenase [Wenzhouxiangella sp. XN201]